jgi:hypothetical protein
MTDIDPMILFRRVGQKSNHGGALVFQGKRPHTYTALEHLTMAMEAAEKNKGKTSWLGHDKGLKSYQEFEVKLKDALLAMALDDLVERHAPAEEYLKQLCSSLYYWSNYYPNWPKAYTFATEKFFFDKEGAKKLIHHLIGASLD